MDNFRVRVRSEGREHFDATMKIIFVGKYSPSLATHYEKKGGNRFVLYWASSSVPKTASPLPTKLDWKAAADLLWHWLMHEADYGPEPDHDGSNGKGWQIATRQGCNEEPHLEWSAIMELQPEWAWYGK